ncbi:uncharacterized protein E0L32_002616 [Thyridium curvatum]|uniref:3'(2'),5'-bisphosphate nucleotidase n=1 Tax=Thyridium curvatum TaxID=1093900 RepID=A0A507BMN0_9PEZI|nr:uncharacterized protein E0L32_002616 [Thyridium curvatum]TPX18759.1 hypothetical protein E0L32_002616 [Thyridium curvatum]
MDSPWQRELSVAIAAVQQASKLSQAVLAEQDKGILEKDDLSPVTVADFAIQALLTATIHHSFPHDGFVGEESGDDLRANPALLQRVWALLQRFSPDCAPPSPCRIPSGPDEVCDMVDWCGHGLPLQPQKPRVWVFDPIDGTKTFIRGQMYAVNVALLHDGEQVLSTVALPLLPLDATPPVTDATSDPAGQGTIVFAAKGYGTHVRPLRGALSDVAVRRVPPILADHPDQLRPVSSLLARASAIDEVHAAAAARLGITLPGCDLLGWVPRWVVLALGLANMTFWVYRSRTRYAKLWDHAGALLLFQEVGGKVTDVQGRDINLGAGRKLTDNYGFVAAPAPLHATVLAAVQDSL